MRTLSAEEARRIEALIPRFYYELLSEVDRRARARRAEDITDECGIALSIWLFTGAAVNPVDPYFQHAHRQLSPHITMRDIGEMLAVFGDHVEDDHAEYLPLFREAIVTPHVQSLAEQLQAFARETDVDFNADAVPGLKTKEE